MSASEELCNEFQYGDHGEYIDNGVQEATKAIVAAGGTVTNCLIILPFPWIDGEELSSNSEDDIKQKAIRAANFLCDQWDYTIK